MNTQKTRVLRRNPRLPKSACCAAALEEKDEDADCDQEDGDEHSYDVEKVAKRIVLVIAQDVASWF